MTGCQCPANGSIVLLKFRVEGFLGQIWGHISYLNMTALLSTRFQSLADLGEGCGSSTPLLLVGKCYGNRSFYSICWTAAPFKTKWLTKGVMRDYNPVYKKKSRYLDSPMRSAKICPWLKPKVPSKCLKIIFFYLRFAEKTQPLSKSAIGRIKETLVI